MKSFRFLLVLAIFCIFSLSRANDSQNFSCMANQNFLKVCNLVFIPNDTNIPGNVTSFGTLFEATFPSLKVSKLVKTYLSPPLQTLARIVKLDTFSIVNPALQIYVSNATQAVHFSGVISLFSLTDLQVDVLAMTTLPPSLLIGLSLPFSSLPKLLNSFFPINVSPLMSVFNSNSSISLVVTNGFDFENIPELKPTYLTEINRWERPAVAVYAHVSLVKGSNLISSFLRRYLGENATSLMTISVKNSSMNAFVGIENIKISEKLLLSSAGVKVNINKTQPRSEPEFSIESSMELTVTNYTLVFNGAVKFTPDDLTLEFSMENVWNKAFGLDRLSFGNLLLSGSLSYVGVPSAFAVGAEIAIGLDCYKDQIFQGNGFCLQGQGYVGIDLGLRENNYFYLKLASLSFDVFLRALLGSKNDQKIVVPKILNDALQFPDGIMAYYSLNDQTLPNLEIKAGYAFKGTSSIFKAKATIDVAYNINDYRFKALLYATPIHLGGVFILRGNSSTNGPYLDIEVGLFPSPVCRVQMAASVTLLGISASVQINIGIEKLSFNISGFILSGLLYGDFIVELNNNNFRNGDFMISASLAMNQAMLDLIANVSTAISNALTEAKTKIDEAQIRVTNAQIDVLAKKSQVCDNIEAKCGKKTCTENCTVYGEKNECAQQTKQCIGEWTEICTERGESCDRFKTKLARLSCERLWNGVCLKSEKVCSAYGNVCKVWRKVIDTSVCISKTLFCNMVVEPACQTACNVAKVGIDTANGVLNTANQIMEGAEISLGGLANAFALLSDKATKIFNILDAGFSLNMNAGNKNSFNAAISVRLNVIILGKYYQRNVIFNFGNFDAIKKAVFDDVLLQIKWEFKS